MNEELLQNETLTMADLEEHFDDANPWNVVADYMEKTGLQYQIDEFNSGEEFINSGFEILKYTMIFLDINMDKMDVVYNNAPD